jgi:hypothetical protein
LLETYQFSINSRWSCEMRGVDNHASQLFGAVRIHLMNKAPPLLSD